MWPATRWAGDPPVVSDGGSVQAALEASGECGMEGRTMAGDN